MASGRNGQQDPSESTPEPPCYDVFISYSSKDRAWVRGELLTRIEQAGLKAFIDFRDFTRGAPSINEMQRGVLTCRKTLTVLTPAYVESGWAEIENIMTQTLDPANRNLRLIPLLKTPCEKPLRIGALTHIDFTDGADLDLAWLQLLTALGAPPEPPEVEQPSPEQWFLPHPYPMPPNFTGRLDERKMLTDWLGDAAHPMLVLRALGGFGKSALTWHWLTHDVKPEDWPRVVWWSFYEGDNSFDHFVERTVDYLRATDTTNLGPRQRVDTLLDALHKPGTLLVLDGFERTLRAFGGLDAAYRGDVTQNLEAGDRDCISPLAEHFLRSVATLPRMRSKVLLTTRLRPTPVETRDGTLLQGCDEEELKQMQPADAVEFFWAQGVRGTRAEIQAACAPYGYHPLSLRLLAGWIKKDLQQPGDIAAAQRLDVSGNLDQSRDHVLEQAYDSLTPERRKLLSRIACFRSPVKYDALKALAESAEESSTTLDADLRDLVSRGLLHHDTKERRFDLHPMVRRYAYDRLSTPNRTATHALLRDHFAAVPPPEKVTHLEDLAPVIELYHHTVRAGQLDDAIALFRDRLCPNPLYYQFGANQLIIDLLRTLFPGGEDRPPRLKDESDQAWTLNELANSYSLSGQPRCAVPLYERQIAIRERQGAREGVAIGLGNVALQQLVIGALRGAEGNLHRRIALCDEIEDEFRKTVGSHTLARLLAYRGMYAESETKLQAATGFWVSNNDIQGQCLTETYRTLCQLLLLRTASQSTSGNPKSAVAVARRTLELADEQARTDSPVERDYVRGHWLLGAAYRIAGQHDEAEHHLHEALDRCRRINLVEFEADILIDLARLRAATGSSDEAQRLAEEALLITERSGYVLQGADAHLELAKLALARGDEATSLDHAQQAKDLATCDGPPDYTYKAAYDEACALLENP